MTAPTMTSAVAAAQDAIARLDEGTARPGDTALVAAYDRYCEQGWLVLDDQRRAAEHAGWLVGQCPVCEEGGGGPECDRCVIDHDVYVERCTDV
jgi:hypothetical protein